MQRKALWSCVGVIGVSLCSAVDAQQLNVAVSVGYEMEHRRDTSLSRSFLQIAPAYQRGRLAVTAPVQVSFRGTGLSPTASNPLSFKSDDWVDLGAVGRYRLGKTQLEWEHHSHQLLSSGVLPRAGYGDVERDDRFLARVSLTGSGRPADEGSPREQPVPGARAVTGYWSMDRWTDDRHGSVGGPVLGLEGTLPLGRELTASGQVLAGRELGEDRDFGEVLAALRYQRASWFAAAQFRVRHIGGEARPTFFSRRERALSLCIGKELR